MFFVDPEDIEIIKVHKEVTSGSSTPDFIERFLLQLADTHAKLNTFNLWSEEAGQTFIYICRLRVSMQLQLRFVYSLSLESQAFVFLLLKWYVQSYPEALLANANLAN